MSYKSIASSRRHGCPVEETLKKEQLLPMIRALKASMLSTAESYYNYLLDPMTVSPQMRGLFDQYLPTSAEKDEKWDILTEQFSGMSPSEFNAQLHEAWSLIDQDPAFRIYPNALQGYSLTFPSPKPFTRRTSNAQMFANDILQLFIATRFALASDQFEAHFSSGEGKPNSCAIPGKECRFIEFETANGLCFFLNQCNPAHAHFSPRNLQITRQ